MNEAIGNIFAQLSQESGTVFQELSHIGHITHTFQWGKYEFVIRTLTIDEEIAVGQLVKHLDNTIGQDKALIAAIAAACLVSINGQDPFPPSIVADPIAKLRENYRDISSNWHWPVLAKINENYIILQEKMYKTLQEIENLSQEGRSMSLENYTDSFEPSKDYPFLSNEDPTASM